MTSQTQLSQQHPFSSWCSSRAKRALDITAAIFVLMLTAPLMLVIAIAIRLSSGGPALFQQKRSGLEGRPFELLKFRTMRWQPSSCTVKLTSRGDGRITSIGKWLRVWKLDELPQFINVLKGEMSIVGPRPDVEEFWREASECDRAVLAMRPGVTGAASLRFIHEEELLAQVPQNRLVECYVREILPRKAQLDLEYAVHASFWSDCEIILRTLLSVYRPACVFTLRNAVQNK